MKRSARMRRTRVAMGVSSAVMKLERRETELSANEGEAAAKSDTHT